MPEFIEVCEKAARVGGQILLDWRGRFKAREKGPRDLVTEADLASQKAIQEILLGAFPDHLFLGEEGSPEELSAGQVQSLPEDPAQFCWIVDPLDGTVNYVHNLQTFAVSIALMQGGEILAGVVYDPILDHCYSAVAGQGAFLNGEPIQTSDCTELEKGLLAASFSANVPRGSIEVARFIEVLHQCQALRRLGSAALNLCYVARGSLDAYWATSVKIWDIAAGVLIVREAGGIVSSLDHSLLDLENPKFAASANDILHTGLLGSLSQAKREVR